MAAAALVLAPLAPPAASAAALTLGAGIALKVAADVLGYRRLGQEARQRIGVSGGLSRPPAAAALRPPGLGGRLPPRLQGPDGPDPGWMLPVGVALLGALPAVRDRLGQVWNTLNSRPVGADQSSELDGVKPAKVWNFASPQDLTVTGSYFTSRTETDCNTGATFTAVSGPLISSPSSAFGIISIRRVYSSSDVGCGEGGSATAEVSYYGRRSDGSEALLSSQGIANGLSLSQSGSCSITGGATFSRQSDGFPLIADFFPDVSAFVPPRIQPDAEPRRPMAPPAAPPAPPAAPPAPPATDPPLFPGQPAPGTPAPQPPGTPAPAPAIPRPVRPGEWQPGGPGTPSQPVPPGFPAPTIAPGRAPSPLPVRPPAVPGAQPTTPAGQVVPRPQPRPPVTRPGSEVINGITISNRPPAPTLQGIAAEVGRIEQKLAYQLRNPEDGNQDLAAKLQELLDALENQQDAGVYELGGPCERDAEGQPIPFDDTKAQFDWGGKTSALANIASRIDALAELLQYHKLLRQPSCKNPQPTGEWVTVNFRQTDFEAP